MKTETRHIPEKTERKTEQDRSPSPMRRGMALLALGLGALVFVSAASRSARAEEQAMAAVAAEQAPETLSEAERLVALYRFVQDDIRHIDTRYG